MSVQPFVDYEVEAHLHYEPAADQPTIIRQSQNLWNRIAQVDKDAFLHQHAEVQQAIKALSKLGRAARAGAAQADALMARPGRDVKWNEVIPLCSHVAHSFRMWSQGLRVVVHRLTAFVHIIDRVQENEYVKAYVRYIRDLQLAQLTESDSHAQTYQQYVAEPPLPARRDGQLKLLERWLPWEKKLEKGAQRRGNLKDRTDGLLHDQWEGAWMIGEGGFGLAGIWVKVTNGRITDRVVRKDTYLSRELWANGTLWQGDLYGPFRQPAEVACHRYLQNTGHIPDLRSANTSNESLSYTMYLEYCAHGDLQDLMDTYIKANVPGGIPEPFLWRTFLKLSQIGFTLEYGHSDYTNHKTAPGSGDIVHRDLKPRNIFLAGPTTGDFGVYPTPKLGDFGLAIFANKSNSLNPEIYLDQSGTPGYLAPEQTAYVDYRSMEPIHRFKLSSKTNVWGVGKTMYSLTALERLPRQPQWLGESEEDDDNILTEYSETQHHYSRELLELINSCLVFDPDRRPTFAELIRHISKVIDDNDDTRHMRDATDITAIPRGERLRLPGDRYPIGMARNRLRDPDI